LPATGVPAFEKRERKERGVLAIFVCPADEYRIPHRKKK
jgi:hypothetical protein